jgi:hypothetical protein
MHTAYQPVAKVLGDTHALMTCRERGVLLLHDANVDILAVAEGRFKALTDITHTFFQVGVGIRDQVQRLVRRLTVAATADSRLLGSVRASCPL